jgi:hypothetical protein
MLEVIVRGCDGLMRPRLQVDKPVSKGQKRYKTHDAAEKEQRR